MPFSGDRAEFDERLIDDLSQHPLANLPVTMTLTVADDAGQEGQTAPEELILPGRRFFQPIARGGDRAAPRPAVEPRQCRAA